MSNEAWMSDERIADIDKSKLDFLQKLVFELDTLSQREKLPFLMALAARAKTEHISFSNEEVSKIIEVIKDHSTPDEIQKMDKLLKMFHSKTTAS
ncbi:MAG: hypothetical protein IJ711_06575 [Lachnospiraceae bacterium]|nr:hypothetical protein [Lachnospiraceae bacterium]